MVLNEGNIDRIARIFVGLGLIAYAALGTDSTWAFVGVVPLLTGAVGFCPLYSILGINTCGLKKS